MTPEIEDFTKKVVEHLAKRLDPQQIILFGSHAKGTATLNSDIDLLVVDAGGTLTHHHAVGRMHRPGWDRQRRREIHPVRASVFSQFADGQTITEFNPNMALTSD